MSAFGILGLPTDELATLLLGAHNDPFRVLGPHRLDEDLVIRVFRPDAKEVEIVLPSDKGDQRYPAERIQANGFFQALLPGKTRDCNYLVRITRWDGAEQVTRDPYCYGTIMGEMDLHLFAEGNLLEIYEKFGAHPRTIAGDAGVYFAVWAPNAQRVSVVGDFNGWDGRVNPMRKLLGSGTWELFLPGLREGAHYKFEIRTPSG